MTQSTCLFRRTLTEPNDLVHIEDVSRKTTIGEILNIVSRRIHYLGFPKMDLNMGLLQPISQWPVPYLTLLLY